MRLVALLSARAPAAGAFAPEEPRIGVHLPVEHQARQAILAGAEQLLVRAEAPTPDLARALDRLVRETGVPAQLVGDGPELARRIEKDDRVLMLAVHMIVPQQALETLAHSSAPALLVTPTEPATVHFERIDSQYVWAGGALLSGETLLATVDMLGEWDLELTLLRRAVQQNAQRIELPAQMAESGLLVKADERAEADRALLALSQSGFADESGGDALSTLLAPVARVIVSSLARLNVNPDRLIWSAGLVSVLGIAAASANWPRIALLLALVAEASLGLYRGCARILLRADAPLWLLVLVKGASLAVLGVVGGRLAEGNMLALSGVGLPLAIIAVQSLADARNRQPTPGRSGLWTRLTTAMTLTVALAGALIGQAEEAYIIIGLCAFGTVAVRQLAVADGRI